MTEETVLLVDNSNSRTKCMLARSGQLCEETMQVVPTSRLSAARLGSLLPDQGIARAVVASVVPESAEIFRKGLSFPVTFLTPHMAPMLDWEYPGLATLGADRIANAMAVAALYPLPCVAIDLGTAVTFDVVVERRGRPCFVGGAIAPGWQTMAASLSSSTAQLPVVTEMGEDHFIGLGTKDSLQIGVTRALVGMVREMLQGIQAELGCPRLHAVATGGDAPLLARCLPGAGLVVDPLLTFRGLLGACLR